MVLTVICGKQIKFKYEELPPEPIVTAAPTSPTREEKLQQQLAEQLQLPGLDTSAPARPPTLEQAKVQYTHNDTANPQKINDLCDLHFKGSMIPNAQRFLWILLNFWANIRYD